jgi:hypothetical protein
MTCLEANALLSKLFLVARDSSQIRDFGCACGAGHDSGLEKIAGS